MKKKFSAFLSAMLACVLLLSACGSQPAKEQTATQPEQQVQTEVKEETKTEVKEEVKEETKTETKEEVKEETKTETKEEVKEEVKEETSTETKEEVEEEIKTETKEEGKEEPKTETKEEVKEEPKTETKEEVKEEPKTETKEEVKEEPKPVTPAKDDGFDDDNIILTLGVLADTHTRMVGADNDYTTKNLNTAMDFLLDYTNNGLDAMMISGDLTDGGAFAQVEAFAEVMNKKLANNKIPILYAIGNHDMYSSGMASSTKKELYPEAYAADIETASTASFSRHSVVNGVHFIQVSATAYKPGSAHYNDKTMSWLRDSLELASKESPNMPIFVSTHLPIKGTVFGSDAFFEQYAKTLVWASEDLEKLLSDYPQVVLVTGHTHYPQQADNTIVQDKFTMLNVGNLNYVVIDDGFANESSIPSSAAAHPGGMLFEVDQHGALRITRFDFALKTEIGSAWVVPAPGTPDALKPYSAERAKIVNTFPVKDAEVTAFGNGTSRQLRLAFTSADSSQNRVYYYEVSVKAGNSSAVKTQKFVTDFYLKAQSEDMKARQIINLGSYTIGTSYTVTVTPYNTWGVAGESQTCSIELK